MSQIQHWEPGARPVARCPCGGTLLLVEDHGPSLPIDAQCDRCLVQSGVSHEPEQLAPVQAGSAQELGF